LQAVTQADTLTDRRVGRHTERRTERQTYRHKVEQADKQAAQKAGSQAGEKTDGQTYRERDRQTVGGESGCPHFCMTAATAQRILSVDGATSSSSNGTPGLKNGSTGHCQGTVGFGTTPNVPS
jgi:hypothetical protein